MRRKGLFWLALPVWESIKAGQQADILIWGDGSRMIRIYLGGRAWQHVAGIVLRTHIFKHKHEAERKLTVR